MSYLWELKRAIIPVRFDEPFKGWSKPFELYWEAAKTVFVHTAGFGVTKNEVVCRYPAYRYEKSHHSPNIHNKVLIDDPDRYFTGSRVPDPELVSLNCKEW